MRFSTIPGPVPHGSFSLHGFMDVDGETIRIRLNPRCLSTPLRRSHSFRKNSLMISASF